MTDYRFVLDTNELDDANVGLGAILLDAERFTLDQSPLNDEGFLLDGDEYSFKVIAQATEAACGGMVAQASGEVIVTVVAFGEAPLDGITAEASATITHNASGTGTLGGITAQTSATITHTANAESNLAGLTATASAGIDNPATGEATLGELTSIATATVIKSAQASANLQSLSASASADIDNPATGEAALGEATANASATITHNAQAASQFQTITASGSAIVVINASGATLVPALVASADGTVIPVGEAIADAPLGSLDGVASATVTKRAGGGGGIRWVEQLPPKPIVVAPKEEPQEVEVVVVRDPVFVFATASVGLGVLRAKSVGSVSWVAERDDEELLLLL